MRLLIFALLQVLAFLPLASFAADSVKPPDTQNIQKAQITKAYGKLPLYFIENKGQVEKAVKFYEKGAGHSTFFTEEGVVLTLTKSEAGEEKNASPFVPHHKEVKDRKFTTEALRLSFVGANKKVKITSSSPLPGHVNYFVGNDKTKWQSNIPTYKAVTYENVYDNIDIKFYGNNRDIEHDIIVRPGADPSIVRFAYKGIKGLKIRNNGDLEVSLNNGKIIEKRPIIYQVINGERKTVEGSYRILKAEKKAFIYSYTIASYDRTKEIVIDPVLEYSTYLGGSKDDYGNDIAIDVTGNIYVTGYTASLDFPTTPTGYDALSGIYDVFITKINPSGSAMVYSTYLGGYSRDNGYGIVVDASENVYITGETSSNDFPLVSPIQATKGIVADVFVTKINASGTAIVYSTFLGGNYTDRGLDIAIDATGAVYVTGEASSTDFPQKNPIQGALPPGGPYPRDCFVTKINPSGSALVYSTYLGGRSYDECKGIAVDAAGAAYVTGATSSPDFPTATPLQLSNGGWDAFITKINPAGSDFVYSTYLGGVSVDSGEAIAVDSSGAAYVTGSTSSNNFPVVSPIQVYNGSGYDDVFIAKINPAGNALTYSTYLGGSSVDNSFSIAVDNRGNAYVTGYTWSTDFTLVNPVQGVYGGGNSDAFVTMVDASGKAFGYSTYLGGSDNDLGRGIAVDTLGNTYVTGWTESLDFPVQSPIQANKNGDVFTRDSFIAKINDTPPPVVTLFINPDTSNVTQGSILGYTLTATNTTATQQCFHYWENITLTNGSTYPVTGELFGPIRLCLDAGISQAMHLTHGVPLATPLGRYALNAYVGAYAFPILPEVVSEDHFTFDLTAFSPVTNSPQTSWRPLENGFK